MRPAEWISGYARAWQEKDDDAAAALFTADAVYRSHPLRTPHVGRDAIRSYWRTATASQRDLVLHFGTPIVDGQRVAVEWWATMRDADWQSGDEASSDEVTLPGCMLLRFAADGLGDVTDGWIRTSMRLTVLGGCGAWPAAGQACSGYLVEQDGFRLLIDPGYATVPRLLEHLDAGRIDAVYVSHGHPDHCADLNPLLRARALRDDPAAPLPAYAPPGALDAVLALDRPGMLDDACVMHEFAPGSRLDIGPFAAQTRLLPHRRPNAGIRLATHERVLVYTGDSAPSPDVVDLARGADLLLAEATFVDECRRTRAAA